MSNKMALDARGDIRKDMPSSAYKMGDEFKPFHPGASHVRPEWRDGWNACFIAAIAVLQAEPQGWMPIETAPVNTQVVALFRGEMPVIAHKNAPNDSPAGWCHAFATRDYFDHPTRGLTHWMPLPTPPKD